MYSYIQKKIIKNFKVIFQFTSFWCVGGTFGGICLEVNDSVVHQETETTEM